MDSDAVGDDGGMRAWQPSAENADRDIVLPRGDNMKRTNVSPISWRTAVYRTRGLDGPDHVMMTSVPK